MDRLSFAAISVLFIAAALCAPAHACQMGGTGNMWSTPHCESYDSKRGAKASKRRPEKVRVPQEQSYRRSQLVPQQMVHTFGGYRAGPRPSRWCGWWMRTQFGGGPEYNLAWNWSRRGVASSPHIGAIVVWRHHVGVIVGRTSGGHWLVKSGNDGGAVRTRARSVRGAVFRALV